MRSLGFDNTDTYGVFQMNLFDGKKTYLAGFGLIGLSVYQFSQGDFPGAIQSFLAGLGALGLRHAIQKME